MEGWSPWFGLPLPEMFTLTLKPCTTAVLAAALDPDVPWVWIRRHTPKRAIRWWPASLPLSEAGPNVQVTARSVEFDLLLATPRFLEVLPEFLDHGIVLFQMTKPVADTLSLDHVPDHAVDTVLVQNGLHLAFRLPHAHETAEFSSPDPRVIQHLRSLPVLAEFLTD